ncbi:MAG: hypothetical protein Q9187_006499 [Circinaria calcarea]
MPHEIHRHVHYYSVAAPPPPPLSKKAKGPESKAIKAGRVEKKEKEKEKEKEKKAVEKVGGWAIKKEEGGEERVEGGDEKGIKVEGEMEEEREEEEENGGGKREVGKRRRRTNGDHLKAAYEKGFAAGRASAQEEVSRLESEIECLRARYYQVDE